MSENMDFKRNQDLKARIRRWHDSLERQRGDRAELSRATTIDRVYQCAAFYRLKRLLEDGGFVVFDPALARMAGVLARIRRDRDGESFGILLSSKVDFERVKLVDRIHHPDRLFREFCQFITRLKGEAPVLGVADVVYWWEVRRPNREFFYDFFMKEGA
jgi:CRISPR system Cascade subunit CasB